MILNPEKMSRRNQNFSQKGRKRPVELVRVVGPGSPIVSILGHVGKDDIMSDIS